MRKLFTIFALLGAVGWCAPLMAQDKPAAPAAAPAAPAPAAAAPAAAPSATAAPAPAPNKGDVAWMLTSTALVLMMSVPALALFYGGLVRSKNMLSVLMQVFVTFSLITVIWCIYGYSLAFTEGSGWIGKFFGGWDRLFLNGTFDPAKGEFSMAATFSKNTPLPELVYVAFQATFAAITCCLILGAVVERIKFSAVLIFMVLWFTFSYARSLTWCGSGPARTPTRRPTLSTRRMQRPVFCGSGALWTLPAARSCISTPVSRAGRRVLGREAGRLRKEAMSPHNVTMTMIGAALLWVGWFGFNAGSALEANGFAALAFMNTFLATACAVLSWMFGEWFFKGKPSMVGAASGAVAGLVAITPAAGNVGIPGAFVIGLAAGLVCLWGVNGLKKLLGADDALDVFGVHAVGGILGALLTGVFNSPKLGGPSFPVDWFTGKMTTAADYSIMGQLWIQAQAVGVVFVWTAVVAFVSFKIADLSWDSV